MRQLLALAFASCFVKNWKYNQFPQKLWTISFELVCKPSFTCLERNEEMKEAVFSRISIYHIEGDIEILLYQFFIILKSGRFYSAPLKCFLISNFVNSFGEREILIFKIYRNNFFSFILPPSHFFKCHKEVYQAYKHVVSDAYIISIWHLHVTFVS